MIVSKVKSVVSDLSMSIKLKQISHNILFYLTNKVFINYYFDLWGQINN